MLGTFIGKYFWLNIVVIFRKEYIIIIKFSKLLTSSAFTSGPASSTSGGEFEKVIRDIPNVSLQSRRRHLVCSSITTDPSLKMELSDRHKGT